jgi:archaemetzincin
VSVLYIVPVGPVPERVLQWIENAASEWFPLPVRRLPQLSIPPSAYDERRKQYQSVEIMKMLAQNAPRDASRFLGVTEVDLMIPMLSFLFGQAQLDGPIAVVSLCRLRQTFYGLPEDDSLLQERVVKEALHELGHTFGLAHCPDRMCAMSLATHVELVDAKAEQFCERCGLSLVERFASQGGER